MSKLVFNSKIYYESNKERRKVNNSAFYYCRNRKGKFGQDIQCPAKLNTKYIERRNGRILPDLTKISLNIPHNDKLVLTLFVLEDFKFLNFNSRCKTKYKELYRRLNEKQIGEGILKVFLINKNNFYIL